APTEYVIHKRWVDLSLAVVLLVTGTPIILLTMAVMRVTSRGPTIFRQTRVGLNGCVFVMYKLRTMRVDAEQKTGPVWATKGDPRVTKVGRILRTLHLDEFPQLINVIRGDMSLVGPRPE